MQLQHEVDAAQRRVHASLCDNVNTATAMAALCDLVRAVNIYLSRTSTPKALLLRAAASYVTRILSCFGVAPAPGDFLGMSDGAAPLRGAGDATQGLLDAFCSYRDEVRRLAKARAPAVELLAAAAKAEAAVAGADPGEDHQAAAILGALHGFREEVDGLASGGAPPAQILAACDR